MGYTTEFDGEIEVEPPLNEHEISFLTDLARTRRMRRTRGPLFVGGGGFAGQDHEADVLDYNSPDPLVGHVLVELGVPVAELERVDSFSDTYWSTMCEKTARVVVPWVLDTEDAAVSFLEHLQGRQDDHVPWGSALLYALSEVS